MRLKNFSAAFFVLLLAGSVLLAGCFEDPATTFDPGDPRVELKQTDDFGTPNHEGIINATVVSGGGVADGSVSDSVLVQFVGEELESSLTVPYTVNDFPSSLNPDSLGLDIGPDDFINQDDFTVEEGDGSGSVTIPAGEYNTYLHVTIDDPLEPNTIDTQYVAVSIQDVSERDVPVAENYQTLLVNVSPRTADITVTGEGNLGVAAVGGTETQTITVNNGTFNNPSNASLTVTNVSTEGDDAFSVGGTSMPFEVPVDGSQDVTVEFDPDEEGMYSGTLVIESNDVDEPTVEIDLIGYAVEAGTYEATLDPLPLNGDDDLTATATFTVDPANDNFSATVEAGGVAANLLHPQHIHTGTDCPTAGADANGDGFIDVVEGVPSYGAILVPLDSDLTDQATGDFPSAMEDGTYSYDNEAGFDDFFSSLLPPDAAPGDAVVKLGEEAELSLEDRHVVIHGVAPSANLPASVQSIGGLPAETTLPIGCGQIEKISSTP